MEVDKKPKVSVIMNCFNSSLYLKEAIDSVLAQTFNNWELIFWDNQSTDESSLIFKSYTDPRFRYFYANEHTSLGLARNLAAKNAYGEWIAFLDCDDIWINDKLEKQVEIINQSNDDSLSLIYGRVLNFSNEGKTYHLLTKNTLPEGDIFGELSVNNFIPVSSALVKTKKYWEVGGINSDFKQAEDYDLFIKISYHYSAKVVDQVIAKYRIHSNNLSLFQKDLTYTESIDILLNYLPDPRAKIGLRFWTSLYFLFSIKRLKIKKTALIYFLTYVSFIEMIILIVRFYKAKTKNRDL